MLLRSGVTAFLEDLQFGVWEGPLGQLSFMAVLCPDARSAQGCSLVGFTPGDL